MLTFDSPSEHLRAELGRLDLLLHREILRLRTAYQLSLDEFRGLYISDRQVDELIRQSGSGADGDGTTVEELDEQAAAARRAIGDRVPRELPWGRLAEEFGLSPFERDVLLLAVAPELDLKYETLYGYLNNDITRKWPTRDLALRLFADDHGDRTRRRALLAGDATLFGSGLLEPLEPGGERPSWLARGFHAAPGLTAHLLGQSAEDPRLRPAVETRRPATGWEDVPVAAAMRELLRRAARLLEPSRHPSGATLLVLEGRDGSGRGAAAEATCKEWDVPLLRMESDRALAAPDAQEKLLRAVGLQQRLSGAGLLVSLPEGSQELGALAAETSRLLAGLTATPGRFFLSCPPGTPWREACRAARAIHLLLDDPGLEQRQRIWRAALDKEGGRNQDGPPVPAQTLAALADRFVLTPGQISRAAAAAVDSSRLEGPGGPRQPDLFAAARAQTSGGLGKLAVKVKLIHSWQDLVLPAGPLRLLEEIAAAVSNRHRVFCEWGFERRIAEGAGLKVLFAGSSGTGKTMTAGVIARDLGLDLFKIDLSAVVSKYIGETEKNLDRIFRAAHCSNAILFFDEADALFGKRSEVKDAHDRYANIEVAYLLQKMEDYDGMAILASNLSKNIDQAFSRRMHHVVEFPLPNAPLRERLWRGMFPPETPLADDIDFPFLARQFELAGGDIKNVALAAAFLAAQDGGQVTMERLVQAMHRQLIKQGKVPSATEFKQYHGLLTTAT